MRLRNNPKAKQIIADHANVVLDTDTPFLQESIFQNDHPLHIEIGMGKGDFIIQMALKHPDINFIGIEKYDSVLVVALNKYDEYGTIENLRFMRYDAADLENYFSKDSVDRIYLNFSDPWPKKKHEKRRLTYHSFLDIYRYILKLPGYLEFKTDNRGLFEYSIISFNQYHLDFEQISLDLHNSDQMEDNVMSEYEKKFSPLGAIYKITVKFKGGNEDG